MGPKEVCEKWNIKSVSQVIDILGLMGDAVDNIPGIPGIGEKTAAKLLGEIAEPGDLVLIKGSRGARTEQVIEQFGRQNPTFATSP